MTKSLLLTLFMTCWLTGCAKPKYQESAVWIAHTAAREYVDRNGTWLCYSYQSKHTYSDGTDADTTACEIAQTPLQKPTGNPYMTWRTELTLLNLPIPKELQ